MRSEKAVEEIRAEIAREKERTALLQESVDHWKGVIQQLEIFTFAFKPGYCQLHTAFILIGFDRVIEADRE